MTQVKFDESTKKVIFDATTGRVQMVGQVCTACPEGKTPGRITIAVNDIQLVGSLGACCSLGESYENQKKIISQGVGWNYEAILEQGAAIPQNNDIIFNEIYSCSFSEIKEINYGSFERYSLNNCQGSLIGTSNFWKRGTRLQRVSLGGSPQFALEIYFACTALPPPYNQDYWLAFHFDGDLIDVGYEGEECFPFGCIIPNQRTCIDGYCICGGEAILTKIE